MNKASDQPKQANQSNKPLKQPKQKKLSLKDKLFLKNLKENNLNQTKAYLDTYPKSSYEAANANGNRKLRRIVKDSPVSIDALIDKANKVVDDIFESKSIQLKTKGIFAIQLTKRQVDDKQHIKGTPSNIVIKYDTQPTNTNRVKEDIDT